MSRPAENVNGRLVKPILNVKEARLLLEYTRPGSKVTWLTVPVRELRALAKARDTLSRAVQDATTNYGNKATP